jgi:hypothetical protein
MTRKARSENHGLCKTPEYRAWAALIQRCTNSRLPKFKIYGGRGITVCDRWRYDFLSFLADMGKRPTPAHSVDRIDPNGNYEPSNCRWATSQEQQWNRTDNHLVTVDGETLPLSEWGRRLGTSHSVLLRRIQRGWSPQRACSERVGGRA